MIMSSIDVLRSYGLKKPFNFRVAVPLLLNMFGVFLVLSVGVLLFADGGLNIGTERFHFLCYLALLFAVGALLSRAISLSLAIFLWCAVELTLAFASDALEKRELMNSLFPVNRYATPRDPRYTYHPVLGMINTPGSHGEWHVDRRNADLSQRNGWPVNRSFFFDNYYNHNSFGLRGKELTGSDLEKDLIFVHGGSTTYDWTVTQGETWVERLDSELRHRFTIVNFGVVNHSTTQHLIQTAFYHGVFGKKPSCSIYYVGWNDLFNLDTPDLDPTYANRLSLAMHYFVRRPDLWAAKYSPVVRLVDKMARHRFDTFQEWSWGSGGHSANPTALVDRFFVEHVQTITAINASRGTRSVFIGQIFNRELFQRRPHARDFSMFVENEKVWPMQEHLNSILERTAVGAGAGYIDAGVENFHDGDFSDIGHFAANGSRKFANLIAGKVETYCQ